MEEKIYCPTFRYHPTKAPTGKLFHTMKEIVLAGEGWVDTPDKFGQEQEPVTYAFIPSYVNINNVNSLKKYIRDKWDVEPEGKTKQELIEEIEQRSVTNGGEPTEEELPEVTDEIIE